MEAITEAELLEALRDVAGGNAPEHARTMSEIRQETGIGEKKLRAALRAIQCEGRLQVHAVMRRDLAGRGFKTFGYTILPAKKKRK